MSEFTKAPGSYEFCGFSFRKNQKRASKFGSILGRDRGLVSNCSAAAGRAPSWTGRALNSSYFGQNDLIPNWILAFATPKWTILVHFGLKRSILVHLGPPTVLWSFPTKMATEARLIFFDLGPLGKGGNPWDVAFL